MSDNNKSPLVRLMALLAIFLGLFLAMKILPVQEWLKEFNTRVGAMGVAGIFIFIAVYAVATVLLAPGAILTIGAGLAFGLWKGFLAVSVGATLGASLAFLVARFIARDKIESMAKGNEKFRRMDSAMGKHGPKLVFLLRLSPVELALIVLTISVVLAAEALNTALETVCDLVSPAYHPLVKRAKDASAAAVLVTAIGSVLVALLLFVPHLGR